MNVDGFRVIIRARNTFFSARLELESQRAFAVIYDSRLNDAKEVVGRDRMEIDVRFLQQITESEYLYKKVVELPEPIHSRLMTLNRENGTDQSRPGTATTGTANQFSL
ncbi:MAG TPA: hypothetical protein VKU37_02070 [Verrucomicrobiae bacterium]|nr:hypothetical protein [Verrucomicrobiae bacterium]